MPTHDFPPTLIDARDAIAAGKLSSVELTQSVLQRIERLDPALKAFTQVEAAQALAQAKEADDKKRCGPLRGVPIALKDNLCTRWGRTTCCSKMLADFRAPYDATVVGKLTDAGAVLIGKTNLDEFAMGSSTENSAFFTTRNPWDLSKVPGGSSGGSAAALAGGLCCGSVGSDTGGSIRQPASLCGVVGLKPTYGRISRWGLVAFASSLDQIGPFGWTVADAALLLQVMAGHDPRDATSAPDAVPDYLAELEKPLSPLRIGVPREYHNMAGVQPCVQAAVDEALHEYQRQGAQLVDVTLPSSAYAIAAYYVIAPAEASSNLARYDGVHYGHRTAEPVNDIIELFSKSRAEGFGPEVQRRIMIGTYVLSAGYADQYYVQALKLRRKIKDEFDQAFKSCDVIACPTSPTTAFGVGEKSSDPLQMYLADIFTVTCNIAGIAAISLPCGFSDDAKPLPIGLQLLGPAFSEQKLLRVAHQYERATQWFKRRPDIRV